MATPKQNRRYRLHQKIKSLYHYSPTDKTIFVPFDATPPLENTDIKELIDNYNYCIQYIIT